MTEQHPELRARHDALVADLRGLAETFERWPSSSSSLSVAAGHIRAVLDRHAGDSLLGITNPAEDVERRAIDTGILRSDWRDVAARSHEAYPERVRTEQHREAT